MYLNTCWHSLRYWGSQVRLLPGAPAISVTYIILNFKKSSFVPLLCHFNVRAYWNECQSGHRWSAIHRLDWDAGALRGRGGAHRPRPSIHKVVSLIIAYMPPLILHSQAPSTIFPFLVKQTVGQGWASARLLTRSYTQAWLRCRSCLNLRSEGGVVQHHLDHHTRNSPPALPETENES